jgi:hypothetical protein
MQEGVFVQFVNKNDSPLFEIKGMKGEDVIIQNVATMEQQCVKKESLTLSGVHPGLEKVEWVSCSCKV